MNTTQPAAVHSPTGSAILDVCFNQDQGCFAVAHENGFLVYNTNPLDLRVQRNFGNYTVTGANNGAPGSGIGRITMLHRTNYLALVGGGENPKFASNKLVIWDDLKRKNSLSLDFPSPVINVLLSRIRIVAILRNQVLVFGFSAPPKQFATYETIDNELGLADLSVNSSSTSSLMSSAASITSRNSASSKDNLGLKDAKYQILAFPGLAVGQIQLVDVSPAGQEKNVVSIIKAHKSRIRCLLLNRSGTLIASASETGTIIRIHSTYNTALLYEFRRGLDRAVITSMKFSHNDSKLAVLSDKNTLHIYSVGPAEAGGADNDSVSSHRGTPVNRQHVLRMLPLPIPIPTYFNSTWSFCSINTNKYHQDESDSTNDVGVLGWSGNDSVIIVWKQKRIWERYVIVEKQGTSGEGGTGASWEIMRYSWKSLDGLDEGP